MANIYWLNSYPKSGNTWLRIFLANYHSNDDAPVDINNLGDFRLGDAEPALYERLSGRRIKDLQPSDIIGLRPRVQAELANRPGSRVFVKSHTLYGSIGGTPLISPEQTAGAVYVIRNPLDVAVSLRSFFDIPLDKAVRVLCSDATAIPPSERVVAQFLSSWPNHVRSWTELASISVHAVRYEDMLEAPQATFAGIIRYLGLELDSTRLEKAIENSSFKVLASQESSAGFKEKGQRSDRFFRSGKAGNWRRELNSEQVEHIRRVCGPIMSKWSYR